jgi:hypothetical protein
MAVSPTANAAAWQRSSTSRLIKSALPSEPQHHEEAGPPPVKRLYTIAQAARYLGHPSLRRAVADAHVQIRVGEGDAAQLAAWNRLWRRLLSPCEASNDSGGTQSPDPVDKAESEPRGER